VFLQNFRSNLFSPCRYLKLALLAAILSGCADLRSVTYPRDFVWLDRTEVTGVMHRLSDSMRRIDKEVERASSVTEPGNNQLILTELNKMISEAESMMAKQRINDGLLLRTNHLLIDAHIDDFLADLNRVRFQLEIQPDNYYGLGNLTGSCAACHQYR